MSDEGYGTVSGLCDVHTCGPGVPPLAVSGWHKDADKVRFLKVPVSQTGLFGDTTGNMAQQFPAAQEQTEVIQHVLPRRAAAASTHPVAALSLLVAEDGPLHPPPLLNRIRSSLQKQCRWDRRRQAALPVLAPVNWRWAEENEALGRATQRERELLQERVSASLPPPEEGRVDNLLFQKISKGSSCLCLWVPRGHGESWTDQLRSPLILPLDQQAAVGSLGASSKALLTHPLPNYGSR